MKQPIALTERQLSENPRYLEGIVNNCYILTKLYLEGESDKERIEFVSRLSNNLTKIRKYLGEDEYLSILNDIRNSNYGLIDQIMNYNQRMKNRTDQVIKAKTKNH